MQQHKVQKTQFDITKACEDNLKQQILEIFHHEYVEGVDNENFGFAWNTILELLYHLYNSWGTITPRKMEDATYTIVTPYDTSNPRINLFVQIEKGVKIANAENTLFTNAEIMDKAYILIQKTGL